MNRPLTILMVTEDHEIQDNISQTIALLQSEWQFYSLHNLEEVIEQYDAALGQYDAARCKGAEGVVFEPPLVVVLLDPHVQGDLGLEAIAYVKASLPLVPIVQILRPKEEELGIQGIKLGAQDYILVPCVSPIKFHRTIRHALRRHDAMQRLQQKRSNRHDSPDLKFR
jgi:DNA-binding response OmpR family regulator